MFKPIRNKAAVVGLDKLSDDEAARLHSRARKMALVQQLLEEMSGGKQERLQEQGVSARLQLDSTECCDSVAGSVPSSAHAGASFLRPHLLSTHNFPLPVSSLQNDDDADTCTDGGVITVSMSMSIPPPQHKNESWGRGGASAILDGRDRNGTGKGTKKAASADEGGADRGAVGSHVYPDYIAHPSTIYFTSPTQHTNRLVYLSCCLISFCSLRLLPSLTH